MQPPCCGKLIKGAPPVRTDPPAIKPKVMRCRDGAGYGWDCMPASTRSVCLHFSTAVVLSGASLCSNDDQESYRREIVLQQHIFT